VPRRVDDGILRRQGRLIERTRQGSALAIGELEMSRPPRIPDRGDVPPAVAAHRLGLSLEEFEVRRAELEKRGFPEADPTTGRYCIEAVDRWRLRRFPRLFPELTASPLAVDAGAVFEQRMRQFHG
jgi:hypothetical protein